MDGLESFKLLYILNHSIFVLYLSTRQMFDQDGTSLIGSFSFPDKRCDGGESGLEFHNFAFNLKLRIYFHSANYISRVWNIKKSP